MDRDLPLIRKLIAVDRPGDLDPKRSISVEFFKRKLALTYVPHPNRPTVYLYQVFAC